MKFKDLNKEKLIAGIAIAGILFGILGLPLILQHFYSIDPIKVSFGIIIVYALINWHMKKSK